MVLSGREAEDGLNFSLWWLSRGGDKEAWSPAGLEKHEASATLPAGSATLEFLVEDHSSEGWDCFIYK